MATKYQTFLKHINDCTEKHNIIVKDEENRYTKEIESIYEDYKKKYD